MYTALSSGHIMTFAIGRKTLNFSVNFVNNVIFHKQINNFNFFLTRIHPIQVSRNNK